MKNKMARHKEFQWAALASGLLAASAATAATEWNTQEYDLYPGDFDGDGKTDLLYVAKDVSRPSGIARSDGSGPNIPYQSWPSNYLGIPWHSNLYLIVVGDFNGDGKDDLFLQRQTPGDHFLLLTDDNGKITGISQTVSNGALGLEWSANQHRIHAGDFTGDGRADLFLQATASSSASDTSDTNALVAANSNGLFTGGPLQTWTDASWSAFKWSTKNSNVFVGDFNGDGRADLLLQARPNIVMIDYEILIPVPTYPPNSNGVALSQAGQTPFQQVGVQQWSRTANAVDWSPNAANIVVADFDGNGTADVLLQARHAGRPSYRLPGNASGAVFTTAAALATNVTWAADSYHLATGDFDGTGGAGVYYQANSTSGTNYYANVVTGSTVSVTTHNTGAATGVLATSAVGHTVGSFAVSDSGAATYSIPIVVPPGVAGLQPALSINYSSGSGNGPLGVGWGLGGFSEISRCNKTLVQDNSTDTVRLTLNDRFCLDGNKLRLTGGSYGAAGSTYQTELETFAKVTASTSSAGNGPAYFTVQAKDGLIYEYGRTTDSRIEAANASASTTVRVWALNKVTDRAGNYMTIAYQEDGAPNGSYRPVTISYTANDAAPLPAAYQVKLNWEARPAADKVMGYVAGGLVRETQRLKSIETKYDDPGTGWEVVRTYHLSYNTSGITPRSRLVAIQECGRDGKCLAPTTIGWQEGTFGWSATQVGSTTVPGSASTTMPLDMNGDGRTDYVYFDTSTHYWRVMFANSDGTHQSGVNVYSGSSTSQTPALPIDVNGDGKRDLLIAKESDGKWWWIRHNGGSSFTAVATTLSYASPGTRGTLPMDVNGDGLDDLVSASSSAVYISLNQSTATAPVFTAPTAAWTALTHTSIWTGSFTVDLSSSEIRTADFDGDARDDLLILTREDLCAGEPDCSAGYLYTWIVLRSTGSTFFEAGSVTSGRNSVPSRPLFADLNADGLTDVVYSAVSSGSSTRTWRSRLGNGVLGPARDTGIPTYGSGVISDCDADGYVDLILVHSNLENFCVRSDGEGLTSVETSLGQLGGFQISDANGDGLLDLLSSASGVLKTRLHRGVIPDFVSSITDGFGNTVNVRYAPLTDTSVYTPGSGAAFPEIDIQGPLYVVKQYSASDGIGGMYTVSETYAQARAHAQGRGFLGFAVRASIDSRTDIKRESIFRQDYPYIGFAKTASTYQPNGTLITLATSTPATLTTSNTPYQERKFPYAHQVVQKTYEVGGPGDGQQIAEVTTTNTLDSYGNPTNVTTSTADKTGSGLVYGTSTVNSYNTADAECWWRGFITQQQVTNTVPGSPVQTRTVQYVKDTANPSACRVYQEIVEPNQASLRVTTTLGYDDFGHPDTQTVDADDIDARTTTTNYGTQGVFPISVTQSVTSSFSQTAYKTYDYALGVPKTATDPNTLQTTWGYDGFGRLVEEERPDGTKTSFSYSACTIANGHCGDSRLRYQVEKKELAADAGETIRTSREFFDAFGRSLYAQSQTLSGAFSNVATRYDAVGRPYQQSRPYFSGFPAYFTTISYDLVGRPVQEQRRISEADSGTQTTVYGYNRLTHTQQDANGKITTKKFNAIGQAIQVTDAAGGLTGYEYDAFGNLKKTIDPKGNEIVNTFNIRGFKLTTDDPDMGEWSYQYYATGELKKQTDAKNQEVSFTYDHLSRPKTRIEAEGTTTFNYGQSSAARNVGRLASVTSPGGFSKSFAYDSLGRLQDAATNADSTSFVISNTYNSTTGLLETTTYPTSTSAVAGSRFKVKYEYQYGLLKRTRDFNSPSTIYWEQIATNAAGQTIDEQYGNGLHTYSTYDGITGLLGERTTGASSQIQNLTYQWDKVGNLKQRTDNNLNRTEDFYYDDLYRLDYSQLNGVTNLDVSYDALGNITSKSNVGSYAYPASGATSVRPHAVTSAGANSFVYDANGNMISRNSSAVTWYSYNLPNRINKGSSYSQFFYGADRARYKQVAYTAAGGVLPEGTETTIYVGGLFERVTKPSGVIEYKHYILAGTEAVAIRTLRSNGTADTRYLHKDHLGSVDTITNESGGVVQRLSYDAFGKRRNALTWSGGLGSADWTSIAAITHLGFTSHEALDNVDLVHMNGRVYDPEIGRFISADPFVQAPLMSQSLNRYSYVMNNPLSLVDPSGYSWLSKALRSIGGFFKKYWRDIVAVVVATVVTVATVGSAAGFWGAVAQGAVAGGSYGATVTALYGGNLGQIFRGALTGAIAGGAAAGIGYGMGQLFATPGASATEAPTDFGWRSLQESATNSGEINMAATGVNPAIVKALSAAMVSLRGKRYSTETGAARALHNALLSVSTRFNVEVGAFIYRVPGRFGNTFVVGEAYTDGLPDTILHLTPRYSPITISRELTVSYVSADWHTHPAGYSSDFSDKWNRGEAADIERYILGKWNGYVSLARRRTLLMFDRNSFEAGSGKYSKSNTGAFKCVVEGSHPQYQSC